MTDDTPTTETPANSTNNGRAKKIKQYLVKWWHGSIEHKVHTTQVIANIFSVPLAAFAVIFSGYQAMLTRTALQDARDASKEADSVMTIRINEDKARTEIIRKQTDTAHKYY